MKDPKVKTLLKLVAFDFHLLAVLVVLFVFSVGAQAIARGVVSESGSEPRALYVGSRK